MGYANTKLARADAEIRRMAGEGADVVDIANAVGASVTGIAVYCVRHGIALPPMKKRPGHWKNEVVPAGWQPGDRELKMAAMYRQGVTLEKIGGQFGITRERVRQLMLRMNEVGAARSRRNELSATKREQKRRAHESRIYTKYGVEVAVWHELKAEGILTAYRYQERNSRMRGIAWKLTFAEWFAVWQASGKLHLRGRGKDNYCMSRIRDGGPYELGNVHVQTNRTNGQEAVQKWRGKTKKNRGVFLLYPGREMAWFAKVGDARLGFFPTEDAAVVARDEYMRANGITAAGQMRGIHLQYDKQCRLNPYGLVLAGKSIGRFPSREAAEAHRKSLLEAA